MTGVIPFPVWENGALLSSSQDTNSSTHVPDTKHSSTSSPSHSRPQVTSLVISASLPTPPVPVPVSPTTKIPQSTDATRGSPISPRTAEHPPHPAEAVARKNPAPTGTPDLLQQGMPNQVAPSSGPIEQQHADSGVRIPQTVVEFPPPYSET